MKIAEGLETGKRYFWKRTKGWIWEGEKRWWEVYVEFDGFNGAGGVWLTEYWHWNSSDQIIFTQPKTLDYKASQRVINAVRRQLKKARAA